MRRLPDLSKAPSPHGSRRKLPLGDDFHSFKRLARGLDPHTAYESAHCPNLAFFRVYFSDAISMTKRYFTSLFSSRS